ncbi:hypothetical protein [Mesorhizobium sp.]|uniref:hypothetical protein n=1 Tax=Mesorhizobium sp. TaxID=1871066 RepID=UPI000FE7200F|nr:hypothetical protein [Mesorhizobium sp.]RWO20263.1 MAG: hypothetical protein EOS09_27795 [Mesorhizobium sp.]
MTVVLMKEALRLLSRHMSYEVLEQDLQLDLWRISQKNGFALTHVRTTAGASTWAGGPQVARDLGSGNKLMIKEKVREAIIAELQR